LRVHGRWFVSRQQQQPDVPPAVDLASTLGIELGVAV
jgi:hypothetical protein